MNFYKERVYPQLVWRLGDPKPIREIRQQIIPTAEGTVLEIGVGPGVNFLHYDASRVDRVYALEPNPGMIQLAERQQHLTDLRVEFLDLPGERIPLPNASVDTVVSTFTLCTIPGVLDAIREIGRILRPDGKLIFFEHGISPDPNIRRWQWLSAPIPHFLFEGCHITRDIPSLLVEGGFEIKQMKTAYLADFPKSWTHCWWGTATVSDCAGVPLSRTFAD
jgi:SAM-dependent methyltransferase